MAFLGKVVNARYGNKARAYDVCGGEVPVAWGLCGGLSISGRLVAWVGQSTCHAPENINSTGWL